MSEWSKTPPTKAGWYWWRPAPGHEAIMERYDMTANGLGMWDQYGAIHQLAPGQWAGPVPEPEEQP